MNYLLIFVGAVVIVIGITSFFFPVLARIINAPGGERIKSIIAIMVGLILILAGLIIEISI